MYSEKFMCKGKVAVVTGGAGLIGREICYALGQSGAYVFVADVNQELAQKVVDEIKKNKGQADFISFDTTCEIAVTECIKKIVEKKGCIDIFVNAAYPRTKDWGTKFEDIPAESSLKNFDMQLNSVFVSCQKFCEQMKKQGFGSVVNFGSTYGVLGPNFSVYEGTEMTMPAAYSAIKGGIVNFTKYLATYYGASGIRVNCICPGGVFDNQNSDFVKKYEKLTPLGRMAKPEEIAAPVVFLCSEAAAYMTGHILMVDGGWSAW